MPASGVSAAWPYDWFHLNSIAPERDGSLLLSARSDLGASTTSIAPPGRCAWELGGRLPSFTQGPGTLDRLAARRATARRGHADACSTTAARPRRSAIRAGLVAARWTRDTHSVSLVASITIPTPIFAQTQGDLERLPDGNWWIGWGNVNESSEVSPAGRQLFEAHTPAGSESYRTLRFPWSARPHRARARRRALGAPAALRAPTRAGTGRRRWRAGAWRRGPRRPRLLPWRPFAQPGSRPRWRSRAAAPWSRSRRSTPTGGRSGTHVPSPSPDGRAGGGLTVRRGWPATPKVRLVGSEVAPCGRCWRCHLSTLDGRLGPGGGQMKRSIRAALGVLIVALAVPTVALATRAGHHVSHDSRHHGRHHSTNSGSGQGAGRSFPTRRHVGALARRWRHHHGFGADRTRFVCPATGTTAEAGASAAASCPATRAPPE